MPKEYRTRRAGVVVATAILGRGGLRRSACLRCARLGWRLRSWTRSGWRALALLYAFAAGLVCVQAFMTSADPKGFGKAFLHQPPDEAFRVVRWFFTGRVGPWVVAIALAALIS